MKKIIPLVASIAIIMLAGAFASVGTTALFSDTEELGQNTYTAGRLDLTVDGENPCIQHIEYKNIAPGKVSPSEFRILLKNVGTLDGQLWFEFSDIKNYENVRTEPEIEAGDPTSGWLSGELGDYLTLRFRPYQGRWDEGAGLRPLNDFDSTSWLKEGHAAYPVILAPDGTYDLEFHTYLNDDPDINVVQSDSVEFDIIFHLDQAP